MHGHEGFTKLGESMVDPFVENLFFGTTTAGHKYLRITYISPPQEDFDISKLYGGPEEYQVLRVALQRVDEGAVLEAPL